VWRVGYLGGIEGGSEESGSKRGYLFPGKGSAHKVSPSIAFRVPLLESGFLSNPPTHTVGRGVIKRFDRSVLLQPFARAQRLRSQRVRIASEFPANPQKWGGTEGASSAHSGPLALGDLVQG